MKTVWVTGGSRGIGAAAVREFAGSGWQVAFTYQKSAQAAQDLTNELADYPVLALQGDMAVRAEVDRCAQQIRDHFGPIDALVVNAGIAQQKMFCDLTDEDWRQMFAVNLDSAFYTIQAVLPDMVAAKAGSIVTVSSVWGVTGASCESHYAASKAGLIGLTKSLAQELGLSGIRVNCVAPGVIDTEMNAMHSAEVLAELAEETALGRLGTPDEVARLIRALCGEDTSFVTGQVIAATGGFRI
ncbi:elongation factor P 5-aminopentanone reductase [Intestinibacillus sp. Marseille-P6563]|uniref:elongation factor P 5-aminopentanone reductase n=1 Tax=Intestinibacillus sp. Marseille-P6563 TaxID=2364792 RepID=UPI000F05B457|nr:SDR family oxidoreductase [Intestinibacillus sp. Marseille-P6563]